jgi:hypothetical protein
MVYNVYEKVARFRPILAFLGVKRAIFKDPIVARHTCQYIPGHIWHIQGESGSSSSHSGFISLGYRF